VKPITLSVLAVVLILVGLVLVVVGSASLGNVSTGGVIFIGPIPIVFGSGTYGGVLALISLIAGVAMIALTYLYARWLRSRVTERASGETDSGNA
jgi:uncharacterized membrane protein